MIIFTWILATTISFAKTPAKDNLTFILHKNSEAEQTGKQLIEGFLEKYDLTKYLFTKKIKIQSFVIPHSHPVLTMNTRQIKKPDAYLALFLHEQIHWFFAGRNSNKTDQFIKSMKKVFPSAPIGMKKGSAVDEYSTYLHFGVCYYELMALESYLGAERARNFFKNETIYPWIRKQVLLKKSEIAAAFKKAQTRALKLGGE